MKTYTPLTGEEKIPVLGAVVVSFDVVNAIEFDDSVFVICVVFKSSVEKQTKVPEER